MKYITYFCQNENNHYYIGEGFPLFRLYAHGSGRANRDCYPRVSNKLPDRVSGYKITEIRQPYSSHSQVVTQPSRHTANSS